MENEFFPEGYLYDDKYSWVKLEKDSATVGVTKALTHLTNDFVFIDLPKKGKQIKKGETYVSMESVKWSGHVESPVSGEIIEVNTDLFDEPTKINENPYKAWIMKVKLSEKPKGLLKPMEKLATQTCKIEVKKNGNK